jgi:hypothetical protein
VNAQVDTFRESWLIRQLLFVSSVVKLENTLLILVATNIESISNTICNIKIYSFLFYFILFYNVESVTSNPVQALHASNRTEFHGVL